MSWGTSEVKTDELKYDSYFNKPGIKSIASSGDSGLGGGAQRLAASPYVIVAGGTTLNIGTTGGTTWNNTYDGSQGGLSCFETEPTYQAAIQSSGMRSTPDVAFDVDPNTGVSVYYIAPTARNATVSPGTWWSSAVRSSVLRRGRGSSPRRTRAWRWPTPPA